MIKESIKFDSELLKITREYCKKHGLKYSYFIEDATRDKLEKVGGKK